MATVAQAVAETLYRAGVRRVYGIIGTSIVDFMDELYRWRGRIAFITTRHEQVAVSAADAEYRVSKRLSAAAVHAGPGFLNTLISLGIAAKDRIPLLLITGGVRRRLRGSDAWLEVEQEAIAKPLVKHYARIERPGEAVDQLREAVARALEPPMGPSVVEVPEDLWRESVPGGLEGLQDLPQAPLEGPGLRGEARYLAERLAEARRPIILASGELALHPGFSQGLLEELAERAGAYIVVSGNGRGACRENWHRCLGRLGFGGGSTAADRAFESSDLVLALGSEVDDIVTYGYNVVPEGEVLAVTMDPAVERRPYYVEIFRAAPHRALREIVETLRSGVGGGGNGEWDMEVSRYLREWRSLLEDARRRETGRANPDRFFHMLDNAIPRDRRVSGGQGTHILYTYNHITIYEPGQFLAATNLGAMGYALPAAIGAAIASPSSSVACVAGDGELMMTLQDLETARRLGLPLKVILVNDNSYKVLYLRQVLQKGGRIYETLLENPDFSKVAEAFGYHYTLVETSGDEKRGVEAATTPGAAIIELRVDRDEIPPLNLEYTLRMSM